MVIITLITYHIEKLKKEEYKYSKVFIFFPFSLML